MSLKDARVSSGWRLSQSLASPVSNVVNECFYSSSVLLPVIDMYESKSCSHSLAGVDVPSYSAMGYVSRDICAEISLAVAITSDPVGSMTKFRVWLLVNAQFLGDGVGCSGDRIMLLAGDAMHVSLSL